MVMKFKFKHVLSYDNKQFYKLTSFDCLPASKLPLKYINGSGPKVFRNDRFDAYLKEWADGYTNVKF